MGDADSIDRTSPAQPAVRLNRGPDEPATTTRREAMAPARPVEAGSAWIIPADGRILRPVRVAERRAAARPARG